MTTETSIFDITTDQFDYAPGDFALFTVTGVSIGGTVEFQVLHVSDPGADGVYGTSDDTLDAGPDEVSGTADDGYGTTGEGHDPFVVTDGGAGDLDGVADGTIVTDWYVNPDDSLNETFLLAADEVQAGDDGLFGTADDVYTGEDATISFTDSSGDFSINFTAAAPQTYNHLIGGGAFDDGTKNFDVVESLEGGDFACGDIVTYFAVVNVDETQSAIDDGPQTITMDFSFLADTTGQSGVAIGDIVYVGVNYGAIDRWDIDGDGIPDVIGDGPGDTDSGIIDDGGSTATLISESLTGPLFTPGSELLGTVQLDDLEWGEQVVVRIDVKLFCDPGSKPTGNLQGALTDAELTFINGTTPVAEAIPGGEQTIPFLTVGQIATPELAITKEIVTDDQGNTDPSDDTTVDSLTITTGDTVTYWYMVENPGGAPLYNVEVVDDAGTVDTGDDFLVTLTTGLTDIDGDGQVDDLAAGAVAYGTADVAIDEVGTVVNTGTATGDDSIIVPTQLTATDTAEVIAEGVPDFTINKTFTIADGGTAVDSADDVVNYTIVLENTGSLQLTVTDVSDPLLGALAGPTESLTNDGILEVGETWTYTGSYDVQQSDIDNNGIDYLGVADGDGDIDNTATATTAEAGTKSDSAAVPVEQNKSLHIEKDATVPGGTADTAGETISYTMAVTNTGNAAIANVVVDDPFVTDEAPVLVDGFNSGDTDQDGLLDVNETWQYTASHVVTQDELDAGTNIDNTATATGDDATPDDDDATVPVEQNKSLHIEKDATVPGGTADTAGETISYTMAVTNTGNAAIANVVVDDPFVTDEAPVLVDGFNSGDTDQDGLLDVNETWQYTASHVVTQDELDAGTNIDNTATATGDDATPDDDDATVPVEQNKSLHIEKDATVPGGTADTAGETISYTMAVTNTGNAAIANVVVDDPFVTDEAPVLVDGFNSGDTDQDGLLDVNETWQYTASHVVTQDELDAGTNIDNTATATGDDATPDDDDATVPVEQNKSLHIEKDATVPGGTADTAGETISYTMAVTNTGNAAIANVVVDDPFVTDEAPVLVDGFNSGDTDQDGLLDVNETWQYTASHVVTQDELDAGTNIDNTATATGDDATPDDDDATVPVEQNKSLHIEKDATVPGGTADTAGETISYTMAVTNTGNAAIANVVVDDPFVTDEAPVLVDGFNSGDTDQDGLLDVNETWQYTASHVVTQDELDAGTNIDNTATATGDDATPDDDDATVPVEQNKSLHIEKDATVPGGTADTAGETISYTMAVTNTGNAAIANVVVDDPFVTDEAPVLVDGFNSGDTDQDGLLDVNETWQYTASHVVTQDELDAGTNIDNTATATGDDATPDDDDATVPVEQNKSLHIEKDATVPGGTADTAGETISYTMAVTNTGNAAIANVVVDDPFVTDEAPVLVDGFNSGDTDQDGLLDVNETWQYTASHVVTQDELDAGTNIDNTATATGDDATPDDDDATVPVEQNKSLHIEKDATVPGGTADTAGETISYTMAVTNTGNAAIANVVVDDPFVTDEAPVLVDGFNSGDTDQDGLLDVNETWQYTASHVVTQDELDAGTNIDNTATATGDDATPDDDDATVPVEQNKSLHIEKDATVPGGTADTAGETISYTMAVTNTGNAAIANVVVDDPFVTDEAPVLVDGFNSGDTDQDGLLDVNETWQYTASHVVTQDELDAGTNIDNTATATGDDATPDDDDATVPVEQNKSLHIEKDATVPGGTADTAGETISYTMAVTNTGNAAIANVVVDDPFVTDEAPVLVDGFNSGDTDQDGLLDVNETWQYTASHVVTQDELDAGTNIDNTATATGDDATPDDDDATVPVEQNKSLHIEKDATVPGGTADTAGETISYTMAVTNTGNAAIANVVVDDPFVTDEAPVLVDGFNSGDTDQDGLLDVNETWQYTASHVVTQDELDAGTNIDNTATATGDDATPDDDDATVPVEQNKSLHIEKDATVPGGTADTAGETISYTMAVTNTGNAAIANVVVDDPFVTDEAPVLVDGFNSGDTDQDGLLDVNETWQYTASHVVTQDELDAGTNIDNTATATGDDATPDDDDATVPVEQNKSLHIEKDATVPGGTADTAGETISYTMAVTNTGNAAIANVVVDDPFVTDEAPVLVDGFNSGDTDQDGLLDVNETWQYTASHVVTQDELDAGTNIDNTATATGDDATPDDDDATVPVEQNKSLHIEKDATVPGGTADTAGETISYTMAVTNTGNAAIANVVVDDPFVTDEAPVLVDGFNSGDTDQDGLLDVNETWQYTASHVVTQDELDAGTNIDNTATATGDDATPDDDDATVPVEQNKSLHIEKDATVPGGTADTAGETISYTMAVTNTGNAAIANVVVDDPFVTDEAPVLVDGFNSGDTDQDGLLDVNETWQYTASHVVTQDELDAGTNIDNTATATGDDATPDDDDATVPVEQNKSLHIEKDATVPGGTADTAGETISYTMAVTNTGNAAIANVVVDDPFVTDEAPVLVDGFNSGDTDQDGLLDVNETWQYTASHVVTQDELDAGTNIDNTATATGDDATPDDDDATVPVEQNKSLHIEKDATVPGGTADTAGETISYTMAVTNTGNAAIANVVVDDPFVTDEAPVLVDGFNSGDTDQDGLLDVNETWQYTASHVVTQDELDAGTNIDNTATATGDDATPDDDDATVPVEQNKSLHIEKDATVPGGTADTAGETISYTMAVTNTGNAAIANVVVDDPFVTDEAPVLVDGFNSGDTDQDGLLDVNETWQYTASHVVTQDELDAGTNIDNTATATGDDATPDDDDATVPVEQNKSLHIEKDATVPGGTADTAGETISYTMAVTNTGNAAIANVVVDDPFVTDEAPVLVDGFNSGDTDQDGLLDVNETWQYTASHVVTQDELDAGTNIDNTATATGDDATPDDDDATVPVEQNKSLHIEKDATVPGGTADTAGETISYTMAVTNTGNAAIANVVVDDPFVTDEAPVLVDGFNSGDTDQDGLLDVNETWQYTASHVVTQDELDAGTNIDNTATATGDDATPDDDDATVPVEQNKSLHIEKDATVPGGTADTAGETISYTMAVTNTGNAAIANVVVDDPFVTDEAPVLVDGFNSGDTDQDGLLDVNETWQYTASHVVTQDELDAGTNIDNTATATGDDATPDDDDATVPVEQNPAITIDKVTNGADGQTILAGTAITWTYTVANAGNVTLTDPLVTDDNGTPGDDTSDDFNASYVSGDADSDGELDVGETWIYEAAGIAGIGDYGNIGTATGDYFDGVDPQQVSAEDPSSYFGANPLIDVEKLVFDTYAGEYVDADTAPGALVVQGNDPQFIFEVENTGNVAFDGFTLSDSQGLTPVFVYGDTDDDGTLDPGETWNYEATGTWAQGQQTNTAEVTGTFTDDLGNVATQSDTDDANYFGIDNPQNLRSLSVDLPARDGIKNGVFLDQDGHFHGVANLTNQSNDGSTPEDPLVSEYVTSLAWTFEEDLNPAKNKEDWSVLPDSEYNLTDLWFDTDGDGVHDLVEEKLDFSVVDLDDDDYSLTISTFIEVEDTVDLGFEFDFFVGEAEDVPDPMRVTLTAVDFQGRDFHETEDYSDFDILNLNDTVIA